MTAFAHLSVLPPSCPVWFFHFHSIFLTCPKLLTSLTLVYGCAGENRLHGFLLPTLHPQSLHIYGIHLELKLGNTFRCVVPPCFSPLSQ